jgi:hypothetical protein
MVGLKYDLTAPKLSNGHANAKKDLKNSLLVSKVESLEAFRILAREECIPGQIVIKTFDLVRFGFISRLKLFMENGLLVIPGFVSIGDNTGPGN